MDRTVRAIYENGVLRPVEPLQLKEGAAVEVTVRAEEPVRKKEADRQAIREFLEELAALPPEGPEPDDGLIGSRDHDKILYGGPKGPL